MLCVSTAEVPGLAMARRPDGGGGRRRYAEGKELLSMKSDRVLCGVLLCCAVQIDERLRRDQHDVHDVRGAMCEVLGELDNMPYHQQVGRARMSVGCA